MSEPDPYYPQSNGKEERWHKTLKSEAFRKKTPLSRAEARDAVASFVVYYNDARLHSAIGYVTLRAMLERRTGAIGEHQRTRLAAACLARISAQRQLSEAAA